MALLGLAALGGPPASAQPQLLTAEDRPIRLGITPTGQWYQDGEEQTQELTTQIDLSLPLGDRVLVVAQGRAARAASETGDAITGLDDARVGALYAREVGAGSISGRLDVGVPVGKTKLTPGELATVRSTSRSTFDFRVPSFGAGLTVVPRLTYAVPVASRVVVGAGAAFQYLGIYEPVAEASRTYDPGNGLELFGGADVRVSRAASLSLDARYARFGTARAGGVDRLRPGNSYSVTLRFGYEAAESALRLAAQYQNWEESRVRAFVVGPDTPTPAVQQQLVPSRSRLRAQYQRRIGRGRSVQVFLEGRYFRSTDILDRKRVGVLGVRAALRIAPGWRLRPFASATAGDFFGVTGGLRTDFRL